uniref:Unconventional myosin-Ic-like n=1 Tax=Phallusia mammillata TaxID=59560 RepID=A0A6F9DMK9_9ASCI|nr:unconventional myosin-Ic-like [Phallusia mammillata]
MGGGASKNAVADSPEPKVLENQDPIPQDKVDDARMVADLIENGTSNVTSHRIDVSADVIKEDVPDDAIKVTTIQVKPATESKPKAEKTGPPKYGIEIRKQPIAKGNGHLTVSDSKFPGNTPLHSYKIFKFQQPVAPVRAERYSVSTMEGALTARDRVGVQDFVLLEEYKSENAFIFNLKKRFKEKLIYTYIGSVLVSVNPYQQLSFYTQYHMEKYQGVNFYEMPPHVYAIADNVYRSMRNESCDQCILISGESGAGKTEASKYILQYLSVCSTSNEQVGHIKSQLLQSNPVLEAFGNAKTHRNDNSSRFGKYMDIQFDYKGAPVGGHILNYLLEKSRVVHQASGERNFHIFYQLMEGSDEKMLRKLCLEKTPDTYFYTNQGKCAKVRSINDRKDFIAVQKALKVLEFSEQQIDNLFEIVASVLHLGNVNFSANDEGNAVVQNDHVVQKVSILLGCDLDQLLQALTHRTIEANKEKMQSPLAVDQAVYARDALAKAVYGRMFNWLVESLNGSLTNKDVKRRSLIGLLDIYGFEIFKSNSFEQFCINFCNEKLQQLFIQLTLKQEQEEYRSEGIEWEPVEYFNNKVICDLVEERHKGIIDILDEECLRPGDASDKTFLKKLEETVGEHKHFVTHALGDAKMRKTIGYEEFRLIHYAGEVTYSIEGFLDKNNDLLFRDLKETMSKATNEIIKSVFPTSELARLKRPETVGSQFRTSLNKLMDILMSKEPSYVRCIKPNDAKMSDRFDDNLVRHQVKYLGLMENLRVRRAGFAYRRTYDVFLKRYKSLCPKTWPRWDGPAKEGVALLCKHIDYADGDYRLGKTKIFIRFPKTLFATEDAFQIRKHELATQIQASFRGWSQWRKFQRMRDAVTLLSAHWRRVLACRLREKRKKAVHDVRKFILGFITRNRPRCPENAHFLDYVRISYLQRCQSGLPRNVLDKSWPKAPAALEEAADLLQHLYMRNMTLKYVKTITPQRKAAMEEKVLASAIFRSKKRGYEESVAQPFQDKRQVDQLKPKMQTSMDPGDKPIYCCTVTKYDRHGYHARQRTLVVGSSATYLFDSKDGKLKQKILHSELRGISTSSLGDHVFVLHAPSEQKQKGDAIVQSTFAIETMTKLANIAKKSKDVKVVENGSILHDMAGGKQGTIEFHAGTQPSVTKSKQGSLVVIAPGR